MVVEKLLIYGYFFSRKSAKKIICLKIVRVDMYFDLHRGWSGEDIETQRNVVVVHQFSTFESALKSALEILSSYDKFDFEKLLPIVLEGVENRISSIKVFGKKSKYEDGEVKYMLNKHKCPPNLHQPPVMFNIEKYS